MLQLELLNRVLEVENSVLYFKEMWQGTTTSGSDGGDGVGGSGNGPGSLIAVDPLPAAAPQASSKTADSGRQHHKFKSVASAAHMSAMLSKPATLVEEDNNVSSRKRGPDIEKILKFGAVLTRTFDAGSPSMVAEVAPTAAEIPGESNQAQSQVKNVMQKSSKPQPPLQRTSWTMGWYMHLLHQSFSVQFSKVEALMGHLDAYYRNALILAQKYDEEHYQGAGAASGTGAKVVRVCQPRALSVCFHAYPSVSCLACGWCLYL